MTAAYDLVTILAQVPVLKDDAGNPVCNRRDGYECPFLGAGRCRFNTYRREHDILLQFFGYSDAFLPHDSCPVWSGEGEIVR